MTQSNHVLNINVPKGSNIRTTVTPPRVFKNMDYLRIFTQALQEIAKDKSYTRSDLVVLMYCLSICDYENKFTASQASIAKECGIGRTEVNKSFKKLRQVGWIEIIGSIGRQNVYFLNPRLAFKTRALNYGNLLQDFEEVAAV